MGTGVDITFFMRYTICQIINFVISACEIVVALCHSVFTILLVKNQNEGRCSKIDPCKSLNALTKQVRCIEEPHCKYASHMYF